MSDEDVCRELVQQRLCLQCGVNVCSSAAFVPQLACKSGRQMRAVEVAEMFPNQQCVSDVAHCSATLMALLMSHHECTVALLQCIDVCFGARSLHCINVHM